MAIKDTVNPKATALAIKDKVDPKPKSVMKPVKKPAAASGSLLRRVNALENVETDASASRDKGKAVKYQKMKASSSLPAWVTDLVEEQTKSASSPRAQKSQLIKLFKRLPDGTLELALDSPVFIRVPIRTKPTKKHITCLFMYTNTGSIHSAPEKKK